MTLRRPGRGAMAERGLRIEKTSDLWWKHAVIYCLDVETFLDSNGDGVGDVDGLVERIDYLAGLGVSCLWLMPFYPSPNHDDGYDVVDYYGVDPRLGDLGELVELVRTAKDRGIRLIADLVVNHTSREHPWFQEARRSRDSPYRNYYVWRDEPDESSHELVFPGEEDSTWTYDGEAGQYYLHHFYSHQPDLNLENPVVRREIEQIAAFWLQQGFSGFRLDAVPYLIDDGSKSRDEAAHELLRELRAFLGRRRGDVMLLGEINHPYDEARPYFGDGDELHMVFDFRLNQHLFLALARRSAEPLQRCLCERPVLPNPCQWANFVTNHDELTLDQLSDTEREEVMAAFAPDEDMRLYGRGVRRRLPTMLDQDERRIFQVYSLLFALPGTPVLFYGEEIGMGENLAIAKRKAVRSPMQWSDEPNGGFSEAPAAALVRPVTEGPLGPTNVNVAAQRRTAGSLFDWVQRLIRRRRECPEIGFGEATVVDAGSDRILAIRYDWQASTMLTLYNLSARKLVARLGDLELPSGFEGLAEIFADGAYEPLEGLEVLLHPYGHRWLRMRRRGIRLPL